MFELGQNHYFWMILVAPGGFVAKFGHQGATSFSNRYAKMDILGAAINF